MDAQTVGWVCDRATSKRRIRVAVVAPGCVELLVEVTGQPAARVELDFAGAEALGHYMVEALLRLLPAGAILTEEP
jgi:hypothetical protein